MSVPPPRIPTLAEQLTAQFHAWERRGRGWDLWELPVELEPPFIPFYGHFLPIPPAATNYDDGRLPGLWERMKNWFATPASAPPSNQQIEAVFEEEAGLGALIDDCGEPLVELQLGLPEELAGGKQLAEQLLLALAFSRHPVGFEIIGDARRTIFQLVCRESDADHAASQLAAHYPELTISRNELLINIWPRHGQSVVVDFGLSQEFMLPLRTLRDFKVDPLTGFPGALDNLQAGETGMFQVLLHGCRQPWAESVFRAVTDGEGHSFFADAPKMVELALEKIARPLFAAVIRIGAKSPSEERAWQIAKALGSGLMQFTRPSSNELIPLTNDCYPASWHEDDLLQRRSHRGGMLLSSDELVNLAHLPENIVRGEKLERQRRLTKAAPEQPEAGKIILGENIHRGRRAPVTLTPAQRVRHTYVIGASGTGKSTLLLSMIMQDIEQGNGLALFDPHGDLIDDVLGRIPESRINDVVLFDPADADWPVGFNILSAHSEIEQTLLSSDLVAVFKRLSTSWGDQMTSVLGNGILAMLESEQGGTLADLRRFLLDASFRTKFLSTVRDSEVVYYWTKEFPQLAGRPQAPLLTRLDTFLRPKLIRHIVCQKENKLDFASIMNEGKIFLAKLAQGAVGEENAHLLGTLLVSKIHQITLSRQELAQSARRDFFLYLDEFHNFVTPSMAAILSGMRKYRLGLILAHQELRQLGSQDTEVLSAVLSNPCTRICFRVGDADAVKLAPGFVSFNAQDLQRLGVGEAIARIERADHDFNLITQPMSPVDGQTADAIRDQIRHQSRVSYATLRAEVEQALKQAVEPTYADSKEKILTKQPVTQTDSPDVPPIAEPEPVSTPLTPEVKTTTKSAIHKTQPASTEPSIPGRGGQEHKHLQRLIKQWAEGMGWRATIEKPILDGAGCVDVLLEKDNRSIACEIGVTTPVEKEVGNIEKCLKAKIEDIVSVSNDRKHLEKIRVAAKQKLKVRELANVHFFAPAALFEWIEQIEAESASHEKRTKGFKVKVRYAAQDSQARTAKKRAISAAVAESLEARHVEKK